MSSREKREIIMVCVSLELSLFFLGHFCFYKFSGRVDLKPLGSCNFPTIHGTFINLSTFDIFTDLICCF